MSLLLRWLRGGSAGWEGFALSSVGGRENNQDQARVQVLDPADNLWGCSMLAAVADGMGGHEQGARASELAIATVWEVFAARQSSRREFSAAWLQASPVDLVGRAIRLANGRVHAEGGGDAQARAMGTTLTLLAALGPELVVGHVGDSRVYAFENGELKRITQDHTFLAEALATGMVTAEEAADSPFAGQITRGVGLHPEVVPDVFTMPVAEGMAFILCSDGLTGVLDDADLQEVARASKGMRALAGALIAQAETRDPGDNISVVCVRFSQ
jgi:PPM family protein phosphatase